VDGRRWWEIGEGWEGVVQFFEKENIKGVERD